MQFHKSQSESKGSLRAKQSEQVSVDARDVPLFIDFNYRSLHSNIHTHPPKVKSSYLVDETQERKSGRETFTFLCKSQAFLLVLLVR